MSKTRPHPPRLQHSPSLPNIWFPPHSGPIPPQLSADIPRDKLLLPLPPPSLDTDFSATNTASRKPRRQRGPVQHDLLTPPLTPSSSIRTASSFESTVASTSPSTNGVNTDIEIDHPGELLQQPQVTGDGPAVEDHDESSSGWTRFLLVRNVSRSITAEVLNRTFMSSFSFANLNGFLPSSVGLNLSTPAVVSGTPSAENSPVKGIHVGFLESQGFILLAFFDVRYAQAAKIFLSARSTEQLDQCVEQGAASAKTYLDCCFVSNQSIVKMVGDSPFLKSSIADFYITVQGTTDNDNTRRDINMSTLKTFLQNYGALRSFSICNDQSGKEHSKTFHIEYYDVRDALTAISSLDGPTYFGMELKVSGQDGLPQHSTVGDETPKRPVPTTNATASDYQDHTSHRHRFYKPTGHLTQHRERYVFPDESGKSSSASDDQQTVSTEPTSAPSSASPTYFYTSPTSESPKRIDESLVNGMRNLIVDPYRAAQVSNSDCPAPLPGAPYLPTAGADCAAFYYAPRDSSSAYIGHPHPYYSISPGGTPHVPFHTTPGGLIYPGSPPSVSNYSYEYNDQDLTGHSIHPQPLNVTNWSFEQAVMASMRPYQVVHAQSYPPTPSPEYWGMISTAAAAGHQGYFHPQAAAATMLNQVPMQYVTTPPPPNVPQPAIPMRDGTVTQPVMFGSGGTPPSPGYIAHSTPAAVQVPAAVVSPVPTPAVVPSSATANITNAQGAATGASNKDVVNERNQLRIDKIEEGVDTRTTVMIKNIPNKMSDKDLITFIGKVCPRRIDFLYLRMDFKNGCNVGYAFVNFITVEDLLNFAKKRLGQKWNMFSSEKVLQMSYANYQGKEALVEKFKNSCIMDECEAWQPKIFYSDLGPEQGLPEPFPAPTHLRRKERSSHNRGALFVPGTTNGGGSPTNSHHHQHHQHHLGLRRRHDVDSNSSAKSRFHAEDHHVSDKKMNFSRSR